MAYTVDFSNGVKPPITVNNNGINTTTNIGFVGQGYTNYGEVVAENLLHLLENFASGTAPSKPVEGQLWYDSVNNQLNYFDDTVANSGNWKALVTMSVQSNAPTGVGEADGHWWLDIDTGTVNVYYNGSWEVVAEVAGDTRVITRSRYDTSDALHKTVEFVVNSEIVSIASSNGTDWVPQNSGVNAEYLENGTTLLNTQFPTIKQGVNLNAGDSYVFNGTATSALYADLAERYHADQLYTYGTVVKIGGENEVTETVFAEDTDVFGVVSDNPAFMMNAGAGTNETHPFIALAGRVPVKVIGTVNKGQRLVSSNIPGYAQVASENAPWQTIIGRALENKINSAPGIVEAVVGAK